MATVRTIEDPTDPRLADYVNLTDVGLRRRLEPAALTAARPRHARGECSETARPGDREGIADSLTNLGRSGNRQDFRLWLVRHWISCE